MNVKKTTILILTIISIGGITALADSFPSMSVQVKKGDVRSTPSFLGKIVARLSYGDQVQVQGKKGSWMLVDLVDSGNGWIHTSALTRKNIVLRAGQTDVQQTADSDEIALAGKGFNEQVEGEFKAQNPNIDYTWIDKMENIVISRKQMLEFLQEGDLNPSEGV
jgi:hypothetical protein